MKGEYHLELINNCMHRLVGRENDCRGSNIPQNRVFHDWFPHPPLVVWNDLYKDHYFNLLPFSYKISAYKDQNQNWCVIGYVNVQKCLFTFFGHFRPSSFFLVTMATSNKLRERNIAYLIINTTYVAI